MKEIYSVKLPKHIVFGDPWYFERYSGEELNRLIVDVYPHSQYQARVVLEEIPFNLIRISREVFVVIEQIAAEQNIRVVWEKKEVTHWNLIGSPGYVKRIMMNILSNAVKYNKENGYIRCVCRGSRRGS